MDVRHPDIEKFIEVKKDLTKVTGANISVMLRDDFMEAVRKDEDYILRFPCDVDWQINKDDHKYNEYNQQYEFSIEDGKENVVRGFFKKVKARQIWDKLIDAAHASAEPGIMFIDRHWGYSPDTVYPRYKGITTNP